MQIFKFSYKHGKGKKLGDLHYTGTSWRLGVFNGLDVVDHILGPISPEGLVDGYTADHWNEEAIMCCTGKDYNGKWRWIIVCNKEHAKKAVKRNMAKFGTEYWQK